MITYHGRIFDSADRPLESNSVTFRIRVYSPNPAKCLLYEEQRTISMVGSGGIFVIPIGNGVGVRTSADPGIVMEKIFANDPNHTFDTTNTPKIVCNSGVSYTPGVLDQRQLLVSFDNNSGVGEQLLPMMDIGFVPLSVNAYNAQNIGGAPANSVLRVSGGSANPLSVADFNQLLALINGTSSQYSKSGQLNGMNLPALSNGQVLGWSGGSWVGVNPMTSYTETDPSVKAFAKADLTPCAAGEFLKPSADGAAFECAAVPASSGGTVTSVAAGTQVLRQIKLAMLRSQQQGP